MDIGTVGIVGAGVMGAGVAQVAAEAGCVVRLVDQRAGAAEAAIRAIAGRLDKRVGAGRMAAADRDAVLARLAATDLAGLAACDLVVEAIVENLDAKTALFRALDDVVAPGAILASNTSSLSITAIQAATARPERVAGLHFFNPVPAMKLVEIIPGIRTASETIDALAAFTARIGKVGIRVKDTPGFLVNHAGRAYVTEALHILSEGVADVATIDAIMRDCCGFRLGPFELMDLTGLDVNHPVSEIIHQGFYQDPRLKTVPLHRTMREGGLLGRKTGRGFHDYSGAAMLGMRHDAPESMLGMVSMPSQVVVPRARHDVSMLFAGRGIEVSETDDGTSPIVAAVEGFDATSYATSHGLDPRRFVAVDALFATAKRVVIMAAPGAGPACISAVESMLCADGRAVSVVGDSPGFVAQRIVAMILNLAGDIAQARIAAPPDIDRAVTLGLAYPKGPLAWADEIGLDRVVAITSAIREVQDSERYRVSPWLRRRARLGLSALTE